MARKSTVCFDLTDLAFPVTLTQQGPDKFTVTYGLQVRDKLTYTRAAMELGAAIMHALACDGKLDNSEPRSPAR